MKKFINLIEIVIAIIIGIPTLLIICIVYLLFVPFDIIRYHAMPYYKDFKNKYELFITSRDVVKIYNRIVRENLEIEYVKNNDFEYFIKDGQVLLCGWGNEQFEQIDDDWCFIMEEESDISEKTPIQDVLSEEIEKLKYEHRCLPIKFLILYEDITDADIFEKAKECPYFCCLFSVDEI